MHGDPVKGTINSADANAGVEITLYEIGSSTTRAITADEILLITDIMLVAENGGDCHVFIGADATPGAGETILRGNFQSQGGANPPFLGTPNGGVKGGKPFVVAPIGQIDVNFTGRIIQD